MFCIIKFMPFPALYTAASIVWYSTVNLFVKSSEFYSGDTKVFKFKNNNKRALILLHGISGTGDSGYIKHAYRKLKNKYDLYAPEYGTSEKHLYPTYLPVKDDPVFQRDVVALYRDLCKEYEQISFVAFSAGGGALMLVLNSLAGEDLEKLNTAFFVSPAFEMEVGFKYLENVWGPVRFFMKYDYWKKFFWWLKKNKGWKDAFKFYFSCRTFDDVFKYFSGKDASYPELKKDVLSSLNKRFVLLHPDDDPIVQLSSSLRFLKETNISRINQLVGGHIGFKALDRFAKFYQDDEDIDAHDLWDMSKNKR